MAYVSDSEITDEALVAPMIAIAIVTFGMGSPIAPEIERVLHKWGWEWSQIDGLRPRLRDPRDTTSRVYHKVDGEHEWTQRAVYGQASFPGFVKERIVEIDGLVAGGKYGIFFEACETG